MLLGRIFGAILLLLFFCFVGWAAYSISDRESPVTDVRVMIANTPIEPGGSLEVDVQTFYRKDCSGLVKRTLYDSKGEKFLVTPLPLAATGVGAKHSPTAITVASTFSLGEGRYVSNVEYYCNWFQEKFWPIKVPERYASFQVIPKQ